MRLFEVVTPPTGFAVTKRFLDDYEKFRAGDPTIIPDKLKKFATAKLSGQLAGKKDEPFSANPEMIGFWKFHLILGKAVLIYQRSGDTIRLYDVVEHKMYNRPASQRNFGRWANKLSDNDFTPIDISTLYSANTEHEQGISVEQKTAIDHVIYDLVSAAGFFILKDALEKNDWSSFFEYLDTEVPGLDQKAVFIAYQGQNRLKDFILKTINKFGKLQTYQNT